MTLPNWVYDNLKWIAMICLPAFKVAIPKLFETWGLPLGAEIAQTLDIVGVLLGSLLGVSCATYKPQQATEDVEDVEHSLGADYGDTDKG